jgi:exopolysaccharide biosynthesis polyprenyl glycosylphosphotransferase
MSFTFYWAAVMMAVGVWILLFRAFELDRSAMLGWENPLAISRLLAAVVALLAALLAGSYLGRTYYSRLLLALLPPVLVVLLAVNRFAYQAMLRWLRKYGVGLRRVVIVGQSDLAEELGKRIRQRQDLNYELLGFLYPTTHRTPGQVLSVGRSGAEDIARDLANNNVDEVIFTIPIRRDTAILDFIASCQRQGIQVKLIPEYYELHTKAIAGYNIDGIPIFELKEASLDAVSKTLKLLMDYSTAATLLAVLSPVIMLISAVLAILWKGRILTREARVGLNGRNFVMYRFDVSLAELPEQAGDQNWKTRVCRFLLRYSLSELPQLWNVLKGEMSIVGPRPETPERVRHYSAWHKRRLQVKPGITGLAQVRGLRGFDSSDLKTKYDLEYVATFSPLLDLTLMVATIDTLLRRRKASRADGDTSSPPPVVETLSAGAG